MIDFLISYFLWIKALHIILVICWMAGLLYLPRLFAYHATVEKGTPTSEIFKRMERRLMKIIMNPAMIGTFLMGGLLLITPGAIAWHDGWLHLKLVLVLVLAGAHGYFARCLKAFERDANPHSEKFYRLINEIPSIIMVAIVILAIVKPF